MAAGGGEKAKAFGQNFGVWVQAAGGTCRRDQSASGGTPDLCCNASFASTHFQHRSAFRHVRDGNAVGVQGARKPA